MKGDRQGTFRLVEEVGSNFRMSDIQAAIGRVQLRKLDQLNARRREIAKYYDEEVDIVIDALREMSERFAQP